MKFTQPGKMPEEQSVLESVESFPAQSKEFSFALTRERERTKEATPRSSCFEKAARLITVCEMFFKSNVNEKVFTLRKKSLKQLLRNYEV